MSSGDDIPAPPLPEAGSLERGNLTYLPVVPSRMESAVEVRRAILKLRPGTIAVEMPNWLGPYIQKAVARLPQMSALVYEEEGSSKEDARGIYLVVEPADPFVEACRSAVEIGAEVMFLEPDGIDRPHLPDQYPDSYAARAIGWSEYVERYRLWPQARSAESDAHARAMAYRLQGADPSSRVLVVSSLNLLEGLLDAMETPQEAPQPRRDRGCDLVNPHPECLAEITTEMPSLQEAYERWRVDPDQDAPDRRVAQVRLLKEAETSYEAQTGEPAAIWQKRLLARFARNLALIEDQLVAGLFDLVTAARSVVDDNFGWEVWNAANAYAWQRDESDAETVSLSGEDVFLETRRLRLRRRLPRPKQMLMPRGLRRRPKEKKAGEWAEQLDGSAICSYPPEDIVIEDYGKLLRQRAKTMLSEERSRVERFTTSIHDGIDIRETIRNWHEGKIYVRKFEKRVGDVGAVVVIFDEDRENRCYYMTTWLGEHQNESDMAFYSTHPFDHLVGPGIGRAEYGGFLMVLPPRRMADVWSDPDYDFAESKPERLLLAALDYSRERHVVYVAAKPPRSVFRSIAGYLGRSVLYVPIGQLSQPKLKKIRVVHVLDGHDKREIAKDYLW
jgi:hypothetical protein